MNKAIILSAGEGSRLKNISRFKPIVKIYGTSLLELTYQNLNLKEFQQVSIILHEDQRQMDLSLLPCLSNINCNHFFKTTRSSMHSLYEACMRMKLQPGEHFFVTMVDSIVRPSDAKKFHKFCHTLKANESAIMATSFIDDEMPLTLKVSPNGDVESFQCPLGNDILVTSGVYYFSEHIRPLLFMMVETGQLKMRNFLTELVKLNHKIKVFHVTKTLDIDRPQDIKIAEDFLMEYELELNNEMDTI